jgi:hypothetical protein
MNTTKSSEGVEPEVLKTLKVRKEGAVLFVEIAAPNRQKRIVGHEAQSLRGQVGTWVLWPIAVQMWHTCYFWIRVDRPQAGRAVYQPTWIKDVLAFLMPEQTWCADDRAAIDMCTQDDAVFVYRFAGPL